MRFCLLLLLATTLAAEAGLPLPHLASDLPTDPSVTWGRLDNGLVYAIKTNAEPPQKLSIRMFVDAGSLQETDPEAGLAHFLEHMAFNGTTDFPPGTLVEQLQEMGAAFGSHTNAHTSFNETVYKLDLPDTTPETLNLGMHIMAQWARGMTILEEEVERERGIILAEKRDRDGPEMRIWEHRMAACYPGLKLPDRFPIGKVSTIEAMDAALLRGFYDAWYRPERLVVTVVGECEPAAVEAVIAEYFAPLTAAAEPREWDPGTLQVAAQEMVTAHYEEEADGTNLVLVTVKDQKRPSDSLDARRDDLLRDLAAAVISQRLADIADGAEAPIQSGQVYSYFWNDLFHAVIAVKPRPGQSLKAAAVLDQSLRHFLLHGPTVAELDIAIANVKASLDQAVARADNRSNSSLASSLYQSVRDQSVFMNPQQYRDVMVPLLDAATPQAVQQALVEAFDGGHRVVSLEGRHTLGDSAVESLTAALAASRAIEVEALDAGSEESWAYAERPEPGTITSTTTLEHGIVSLQLANGVHAAVMARDAKPDEVLVELRLHIEPQPIRAGLAEFTAAGFMTGGLGAHDAPALRRVLAGTTARVGGPSLDADAVVFSGSCRRDELELCLQQLRAYLTDPGWRPQAFARAKRAWIESIVASENDLDTQFRNTLTRWTAGGYPQRRSASLSEAEWMHVGAAKAWLTPILETAPIELSVVGDVDPALAGDLIAAYFGSLDKRPPVPVTPDLTADGALAAWSGVAPAHMRMTVNGSVPRAMVYAAWPTDDAGDVQRTRRLGLLGGALRELLRRKIREELGEAYSPSAGHLASDGYDRDGRLVAMVSVKPGREDVVLGLIRGIAAEIAVNGVPEDVFTQTHEPQVANMAAYRHGNGYWMSSVVSRCHSEPQRLEWSQSMVADYESITKAELDALATEYFKPDREFSLIAISPDKTASQASSTEEAEALTVEPEPVKQGADD